MRESDYMTLKQQFVGEARAQGYPQAVTGGNVGQGCVGMAEGRQTAKGVIRERINRLHREAAELQALLDSLPEVLPPHADSALWNLAIGR